MADRRLPRGGTGRGRGWGRGRPRGRGRGRDWGRGGGGGGGWRRDHDPGRSRGSGTTASTNPSSGSQSVCAGCGLDANCPHYRDTLRLSEAEAELRAEREAGGPRAGLHMVGTCMAMCPLEEALRRQVLGLLHPLERQSHPGRGRRKFCPPLPAPGALVKEFSRPAAGKTVVPSRLRPSAVLLETAQFLAARVATRTDCKPLEVYFYLFDRTRAIRQDIVCQGLWDDATITTLEMIVRFHLDSQGRHAATPDFDEVMNRSHLNQAFATLFSKYARRREGRSIGPGSAHARAEAELHAYFILSSAEVGSSAFTRHFQGLPEALQSAGAVQSAVELARALLLGNYVRAFRLASTASWLQLCGCAPALEALLLRAVDVMLAAYATRVCRFPLADMTQALHLADESAAALLCSGRGVVVEGGHALFRHGTAPPEAAAPNRPGRFALLLSLRRAAAATPTPQLCPPPPDPGPDPSAEP